MHHSKPMVLASIVMLSILWGSSFIAIKIVVEGVTPLVAFGMRFFMAGILLIATHYILHYINLKRSNTIDYHHITIKNKQMWRSWYHFLMISSISWAMGSIYSNPARDLSTGRAILLPTGMFMLIGGIILLAISIFTGTDEIYGLKALFSSTNNILISFLFLTIVCTAIGYSIFYWLLESTTPSLANTFAYIVPVIAVVLGWVILNESITTQTVIATGIISAGVAMMMINPSFKKIDKQGAKAKKG